MYTDNRKPYPTSRFVLVLLLALVFSSSLALKPVHMASYPAMTDLSGDGGDLSDGSPTPPDLYFPASPDSLPKLIAFVPAIGVLPQPAIKPRLISYPVLPQGPPASS